MFLLGMIIAYFVISLVYIMVSLLSYDKEDIMGWFFAWWVLLPIELFKLAYSLTQKKLKAIRQEKFKKMQYKLRGLYGDKIQYVSEYKDYQGCKELLKNPILVTNKLFEIMKKIYEK